jgi:predicted NBD/HSP70 family sugar kinase
LCAQAPESLPQLVSADTAEPGRPGLLRRVNSAEILRLLRLHGPCSRADLVRASGLSAPTVSSSVEYLENKGLVEAVGAGNSKKGRPPALLRFNRSFAFVVGVDIGGSAVRVILADLDGNVIDKLSLPIRAPGTPRRIVSMVREGTSRLQKRNRIPVKKLIAVAVGAPGITDPGTGVVRSAPHLAGWKNIPLRQMITESLGIPAVIENDVNLAALGEAWRGTAHAVPDFVFIAIGTGVGAGIILHGRLYPGADWAAGEIGYLTVPGTRSGSLDLMRPGPLESVIGGRGIEEAWRWGNGRHRPLHATEILDRAETGDRRAQSILNRTARVLAEGILSVSVVLNPRLVVLGGRIGMHRALFDATNRIVARSQVARPQLAMSALGHEAQLFGAVWLATRKAEAQLLDRAPDQRRTIKSLDKSGNPRNV